MDRETEARAAEILADALELLAAERAEYVRNRCGDDAVLRARVEALLAAYVWGEAHLRSTGLGAGVRDGAGDLAARRLGLQLGPYRVTRLLGTGGTAEVYLAERCEGDFEQQVAVKFLHHFGMGSRGLLERFRVERQLLARLHHPGIARLIDGGATPDGEPYLVMEYVDGVPLDRHCDERGLTVHERLRLFCAVCDAVQYAHRNLVVHRDLKPGNIFVDTDGHVRLLDFGIAKVLDLERQSGDVTVTAQRPMTPRYASPEQLRGEELTTASDVYSLGVLLYELLTGCSPYRSDKAWASEFVRIVCEEPTLAPSAAVARAPAAASEARGTTPRALARALAGDLDTIVLRALHKEPERRYASADELANDIRRHLAGLPVLARPDTLRYRVAKFARRNPAVVAAVAVAFASLAAGLAVSLVQYRSSLLAREEAEWLAYQGSISAAESSIRTNRLQEARRQLDVAPAALRGWEWRHLAGRLDRSRLTIRGHRGAVTGVRFTPDGSRIVSASEDRTIRVWDARTGAELARFGPLGAVPRSLAVDGRGALAAVGLEMGRVQVLDLADGHSVLSLADSKAAEYEYLARELAAAPREPDSQLALLARASTWATVDIDPGSERLAVGYWTGAVQLWDLPMRRMSRTWNLDASGKVLVRVRPGGRELAMVSEFLLPELRDVATGRLVRRLGNRQGYVDLCFDPLGRRLAASSQDQTVEVWEVDAGRLVGRYAGHGGSVRALEFDATGNLLVSSATDQRVFASDPQTGAMRWVYPGHTANVYCLARSPDGTQLATGDWDGLIKLWDFETEDVPTLVLAEGEWPFRRHWAEHACLSPDGTRLVTSALQVWELTGRRRMARVDSTSVPSLAWVPARDRVAVGLTGGGIMIVDPRTVRKLHEFRGHETDILALDAHPRLPWFVTGSADSTLGIWELGSDRPLRTLRGHGSSVTSVRHHPDGRRIASGAEDGSIRIWDAHDGRLLRVLPGHQGAVNHLAFSPDGTLLASASSDGTVRLWDARRGTARGTLFESGGPVYAVAFTHDGARLAAGGMDGVVHLFDPAARREVARLHGHDERIFWLEFTAGDAALLSSSLDGTIRIWNVATTARRNGGG